MGLNPLHPFIIVPDQLDSYFMDSDLDQLDPYFMDSDPDQLDPYFMDSDPDPTFTDQLNSYFIDFRIQIYKI